MDFSTKKHFEVARDAFTRVAQRAGQARNLDNYDLSLGLLELTSGVLAALEQFETRLTRVDQSTGNLLASVRRRSGTQSQRANPKQ